MLLKNGLLFLISDIECSGEGVVDKIPYTNFMVKYCFNCFADYIQEMFLAFVCCCQ